MENRLELNKRPVYELPDKDVLIKSYKRNYSNITNISFEPDLCIVQWGRNLGEECKKGSHLKELWIKSDNVDLIEFVKSYNFKKLRANAPNYELAINDFKKIILEEFYNKRG